MTPEELKQARDYLGMTQQEMAVTLGKKKRTQVHFMETEVHGIPKNAWSILKPLLKERLKQFTKFMK